MLMGLERVMNMHIGSIIADNLPIAQHTYIKGRSTEVINVIEKILFN